MDLDSVPTVGFGVDIRLSSIPGAGNGLYTDRKFERNELITEYSGPIIDHKKALKLRRQNKHSHIRVLNSQFSYIYGHKQPELGQGGASFANDARDPQKNNAVFVSKHDPKSARDRVYLKALCNLEPNTEVFVCYGRDYWKCSKQAPASPPKQPRGRQQQAEAASPLSSRQQQCCRRAARALKRQQQQDEQEQQQQQDKQPQQQQPQQQQQEPQRHMRHRGAQQSASQQALLLPQHKQHGRKQESLAQQQQQADVLLPAVSQCCTRTTRMRQSHAQEAAQMITAGAAADSSEGLQQSLQQPGGFLQQQQHNMQLAANRTAAAHAAALELYAHQQQQAARLLPGYEVSEGVKQQLQIANMQCAMAAFELAAAGPGLLPHAGWMQQLGMQPVLLQQPQPQRQHLDLGQQAGFGQQAGMQQLLQQRQGKAAAAAEVCGAAGGAWRGSLPKGPLHMQGTPQYDSDEAEDTQVMGESQGRQQSDAWEPEALGGAGGQHGTRKRSCSSVYRTKPEPVMEQEDENPYKRVYGRGKRAV